MADKKNKSYWTELLNMFRNGNSQKWHRDSLEREERGKELLREQRENYENYLNVLASMNSQELFSNGGVYYASILMSVLLNNTDDIARIYCKGFRCDLIRREPYWSALKEYLDKSDHKLLVMVENGGHIGEEPLQLLQRIKHKRQEKGKGDTIEVRVITPKGKEMITKKYGGPCNFAIFDDNKFRYEYDPDNFKAYGSFNQPKTCKKLKDIFESAFEIATPLF